MYKKVFPIISVLGLILVWLFISFIFTILIAGISELFIDDYDFQLDGNYLDTLSIVILSSASFLSAFSAVFVFRINEGWNLSFCKIGLVKEGCVTMILVGFAIGFFLLSSVLFVISAFSNVAIESSHFISKDIIAYVVIFAIVAFGEEFLIRGYALSYLNNHYGLSSSIIISSLIFSVLHIPNGAFQYLAFGNLLLAGILLSIMRFFFKSLWVPIGCHFTWNFLQGPILGFPVSGVKTPSVYTFVCEGGTTYDGGSFGIEGSIINTIVHILALMLFLLMYIRKKNTGFSLFNRDTICY